MPIAVAAFIATIILLAFGFAGVALKWQYDYKRDKLRAQAGGNSLPTSELKALIQEAMDTAVAPLDARLELIERQLRQLPEHAGGESPERTSEPDGC